MPPRRRTIKSPSKRGTVTKSAVRKAAKTVVKSRATRKKR